MVKRRHICDVPGCGKDRLRWQRLCNSCYAQLPGNIRQGLIDAFTQHRLRDWRVWKKAAAVSLGATLMERPRMPGKSQFDRLSPTQFQELQQRLLGERPDA